MTSKTKQLEIPDKYYKIIKDRVKISKKSDHTYRIYENTYKLVGIQEEDRYISFYFRNLFDKEERLQEIRCRKFIDLVIYDSFIGAKYILTKEQRKLYESNYSKYYYEKKTIEKREKEKEKNVRVCVMCGKLFHPLGNQLTCSPECKKKRSEIKRKTYALEHKEEIKERNKKWAKENPERLKAIYKKYRSSEKGKAALYKYLKSEKGKKAVKNSYERCKLRRKGTED